MKVNLDFEITKLEEDVLSSVLQEGAPVTEDFLRDFCKKAIAQALEDICDTFLNDSLITPVFEEEEK